jgi:hypothetical protein
MTVAARPAPVLPRTGPSGLAIYGGSGNNGVCDKLALTEFLTSHNEQANAWASVEGISLSQVADFIRQLEPEVLSRDVRVTNHGFRKGAGASAFQSVFQAGTAVLVNQFGYPVVRCLSGNPLTPPISTKARYVGTQWPGFNQATLTIIVAPPGNVPNVPTAVTKGTGSTSSSASWDGTYSVQPSTISCTGDAPAGTFDSVINQAVPASGLVVSGNSIPGPSGTTLAIDSAGQTKNTYAVPNFPDSSVAVTFAFSRDAGGAAILTGSVDINLVMPGSSLAEKCTLPFKGTRTGDSAAAPVATPDPSVAKNDAETYHRIINVEMPNIDADQRNLRFECSMPASGGATTCQISSLANALHDCQLLLTDIGSVPVPPGYAMGDTRLRQGLQEMLAALAELAKGTAQHEFEVGVAAFQNAGAVLRNGIALLPPG